MKPGALFRVKFPNCPLCEDRELTTQIGSLEPDDVVVFLGDFVEGMIFYDRCFLAIKVLTPKGVAWMRPDNLFEVKEP